MGCSGMRTKPSPCALSGHFVHPSPTARALWRARGRTGPALRRCDGPALRPGAAPALLGGTYASGAWNAWLSVRGRGVYEDAVVVGGAAVGNGWGGARGDAALTVVAHPNESGEPLEK